MPTLSAKLMWAQVRELWAQRSGLASITAYFAALELVLMVARAILRVINPVTTALNGWIVFIGFCFLVCAFGLAFRWFRNILMWRLRNRLIVTHVFIGVIPVVLLAAIGIITAYLFAGQFATFVLTSDVHGELKTLDAVNRALAENLAAQMERGTAPDKALATLQRDAGSRTLTVWLQNARGDRRAYASPPSAGTAPLPVGALAKETRAIIGDKDGLHLRTWTTVPAGREQLTVITTEPLGKAQIDRIATDLGEVTLYPPDFSKEGEPRVDVIEPKGQSGNPSVVIRGNEVLVRSPHSRNLTATLKPVSAGVLPPPSSRWDREVLFGTLFNVYDWESGESSSAVLKVRTRPSLLYGRLFVVLGEFSNFVLFLLAAVAIFFALIELVALITGIRLTRTMTKSVAELYNATEHINRGDLTYRIKVTRQDQLAALETSFNSMTQSLERLIEEQKEKQRMESELAIAQEVQAQLFPREASQLDTLEVHGLCRPARTVSGDYYDFLKLGPEKLGLAVGDISGKGISAALLMATIHSAVRVYEFGRMPNRQELLAAGAAAASAAQGSSSLLSAGAIQSPATVLALLNRHLYHSTPAEKYATLFLGLWDGQRRRLTYSNGGHLPPLIIGQDGSMRKLETGGMVIGLFDEMQWDEDSVQLQPGDLFVAYSDGVTEPENDFGEFGEQRLIELVHKHRQAPLAAITDAVIADLDDWIGGAEQPDDVTLVLARVR